MNPSGKIWKADPIRRMLKHCPSAADDCVFLWTPWWDKYAWAKQGQLAATTYTSDALGKNVLDPRDDLIRNFPTGIMPITGAQEPARTNLLTYSQGAFDAQWSGAAQVTDNNTVAPDGTTTASSITDSDGSGYENCFQGVSVAADTTVYCVSCFIKKKSSSPTYPAVSFYNTTNRDVVINEVTGAVAFVVGSPTSYGVQSCGDYWRVWVVAANNSQATVYAQFYPAASTDGLVANGAATGTQTIWGFQMEAGSFPSSYIPTTTAAVARAADALRWVNSGLFDPLKTAGTMLCVCKNPYTSANAPANQFMYDLNNGDGLDDRIGLQVYSVSNGLITAFVSGGAVQSAQSSGSPTAIAANTCFATAQKWSTNDLKVFLNGAQEIADTSLAVPVNLDRLEVAGYTSAGPRGGQDTLLLALFDRALTDDECKALTHSSILAQYEYAQ